MNALVSQPDVVPGLQPPPGVIPNFVDPPSIVPMASIIIGVTLAFMYCFLALRLYTRIWVTHGFGVDDVLCILSAATITAYCGILYAALDNPLGHHQWDVPLSTLDGRVVRETIVMIWLYVGATIFLKSSLLVLYIRLFRSYRSANIVMWWSLLLIVLFYLVLLLVYTIACAGSIGVADSLTGTQNIFNPNDSCAVSEKLLWAVKGAFSVITDIYLLALPVSFIVTLSIPLKRKIGVCLVFLTGLIASAFAVVATVYRFRLIHSSDNTWLATYAYAFTAAELNIGVSCGCMPIGFVVLNNLSKSSWNSLVNLVISQRHDHSCSLPVSEKPIIDDNIAEDQLPKPPKVAMVAMEHFVAKIHSSHFGRVYSISTYDEITLIKEDYHVQLRDWPRYGRRPLYNTQNTSFL